MHTGMDRSTGTFPYSHVKVTRQYNELDQSQVIWYLVQIVLRILSPCFLLTYLMLKPSTTKHKVTGLMSCFRGPGIR